MKLSELRDVLENLNIETVLKIKNMNEAKNNIEVNEWLLTFTNSTTELKIDIDEMDIMVEPYLDYEVVSYGIVENIEVMESYFKKKETILRKVNCSIKVELISNF